MKGLVTRKPRRYHEALTHPQNTLAFCDDTDLDTPELVPGIRILVAIVVPSERYADLARRISELLNDFGQVSRQQFDQLMIETALNGARRMRFRSALKKVSLECLMDRYGERPDVVLTIDRDGADALTDCSRPDAEFSFANGPIYADSVDVHGLQIADLIAYFIGRYGRKRSALENGTASEFDRIAMRAMAKMEGRCRHLLA